MNKKYTNKQKKTKTSKNWRQNRKHKKAEITKCGQTSSRERELENEEKDETNKKIELKMKK